MDNYNNIPNNQAYPQQQYPQYPQYPQQTPAQYDPRTAVLSVGQYIGMFILSGIPIVNVICWIVWLISPNTNKNKKNFLIATIVLWIIGVVLTIALFAIFAAVGINVEDYIN